MVAKTASEGAVTTHAGMVTAGASKVTAAQGMVDAAVITCKRRRYQEALKALEDFTKGETKAAADSKTAKDAYDALKKTAEAAQADCRKDATSGERTACAEGQCCGQANRYEGDGTRRTIEVCGDPKATTYKFWPAMATGMMKAPPTEQWRYYCISGA